MKATKENEEYLRQADKVDFLTEKWELKCYVKALKEADDWSKKIDNQNKEYKKKNKLVDRWII